SRADRGGDRRPLGPAGALSDATALEQQPAALSEARRRAWSEVGNPCIQFSSPAPPAGSVPSCARLLKAPILASAGATSSGRLTCILTKNSSRPILPTW